MFNQRKVNLCKYSRLGHARIDEDDVMGCSYVNVMIRLVSLGFNYVFDDLQCFRSDLVCLILDYRFSTAQSLWMMFYLLFEMVLLNK